MRTPRAAQALLLGILLGTSATQALVVQVDVELATEGAVREEKTAGSPLGELIASRSSDGLRQTAALEKPGRLELELDPGVWRFEIRAPGFWAPVETATLSSEQRSTKLELWPTGTLSGRLSLEPEQAVAAITVQFQAAPSVKVSKKALVGWMSCPVVEGFWRCELPAAELDLRFRLPGFIDSYQWGVAISSGQQSKAGKLAFRRGSAVSGWVVAEDTDHIEKARVDLKPSAFGQLRQSTDRSRLERLNLTTTVNDRGFFHLDGVPPGDYTIEATLAPFATARASVRVLENETTEIADPPLELLPPQHLEIYVDPPVPPQGGIWELELRQLDRGSSTIASLAKEEIAADGAWRGDLALGRYRLILHGAEQILWSEEIELELDPAPHFINLALVEVRGTVELGKEPLAAELFFGGEHGSVAIRVESDEEGRFEVTLPRQGLWEIDLRSENPPCERTFEEVEIEQRPGKPFAEIELRLPDTRLRGQVVNEQGQPVEGAIVTAQSLDDVIWPARPSTDENGDFDLRGLPPGITMVVAEDQAADEALVSDEIKVDLSEGHEPSPLRLVLRRQLKIKGRVLSAERGIPGARIKAEPVPFMALPVYPRVSDVEGRFEISVPATTQEILLSIAAPGFAFKMLRLPLRTQEAVDIALESTTGVLILESDEPSPGKDSQHQIYLRHGSGLEALGYLLSWARFNGVVSQEPARQTLPAMAPGDYTACLAHPLERFALLNASTPQRCVTGHLSAGGELVLQLPALP